MQPRPPDTIDLGAVVLRRWTAADVPALTVAVVESLDHLQPWMVWATPDLATEAAFARFVVETTARAADGGEALYGIFAPADAPSGRLGADGGRGELDAAPGAVLGGVGLHDRGTPGSVEIGYWLHVAATGRGLMTRIVGHLTDLALALDDVRWVEIRCDPANASSAAVARRLGYDLAAVVDSDRPRAPADCGRHLVWTRTQPVGAPGATRT
ncbi:GNAT family N-acetyltransferase [Iamia sp. SCSIO 61187]|uniref:GNAT family N-acetyltransferase n=1 Tax=Iamia sp. SCSIO 61187 TaxID=2722752 RepID=UPI001C627CF3|nr:GNAT family N-acetyltransferase [Iamia sp. SCSIO 61187]QYG91317.1 GNAT family N-acetyltransferase [Iamia sp. SCSIO 61187]